PALCCPPPRPPPSTPSPHTTLFRSPLGLRCHEHDVRHTVHDGRGLRTQHQRPCPGRCVVRLSSHPRASHHRPHPVFTFFHPWHQDRKSTRLNSSHVKISYAVFCLKR